MDFLTEGSVIMDSWPEATQFKVKNVLMLDLFLTNLQLLTSQDINWWTGLLVFNQLFGLSFWRHPFTTKDPNKVYKLYNTY